MKIIISYICIYDSSGTQIPDFASLVNELVGTKDPNTAMSGSTGMWQRIAIH